MLFFEPTERDVPLVDAITLNAVDGNVSGLERNSR